MSASRYLRVLHKVILSLLTVVLVAGCKNGPRSARNPSASQLIRNPIADMLKTAAAVPRREGIAAAILIDTSGSMREQVAGNDGSSRPKIQIVQHAAVDFVNQVTAFARANPDKTVYLAIYEFSERRREPSVRTVIKLGPPDPSVASAAIEKMKPEGDTPIGDAMVAAMRDLNASGLSKRHILVLTDGENNKGYSPTNVMQVLGRQPEQDRASVYFVAFDIAASKFNSVKDAGGLVLAASNETDLKNTLDYLLTGKILAEQPAPH